MFNKSFRLLYLIMLLCFLTACKDGLTQNDCLQEASFLYDGICTEWAQIPTEDQKAVMHEVASEIAESRKISKEKALSELLGVLKEQHASPKEGYYYKLNEWTTEIFINQNSAENWEQYYLDGSETSKKLARDIKQDAMMDVYINGISLGQIIENEIEVVMCKALLCKVKSNYTGSDIKEFYVPLEKIELDSERKPGSIESKENSTSESKSSQQKPQIIDTIIIGVNGYSDGLGSENGFAVDLLMEILNSEGYGYEFQQYNTYQEEMRALQTGEVDILIDVEEEIDTSFSYTDSYNSVHTSDLVYALTQQNQDLVNIINEGINKLKSNRKYKEIFIKHYGEENYNNAFGF